MIRHSVVAQVITGVIVTALLGFLASILGWIDFASIFEPFWTWLNGSVPLWWLALAFLAGIGGMFGLGLWAGAFHEGPESVEDLRRLSAVLDLRILHLYYDREDDVLDFGFIRSEFPDVHKFRVQRALDELIDRGWMEEAGGAGSRYRLTSEGRKICLLTEYQATLHHRRPERREEARKAVARESRPKLGTLEWELLLVLRDYYRTDVPTNFLRTMTDSSLMEVADALRTLAEEGLVEARKSGWFGPRGYGLTDQGVDLVDAK